MLQRMMRQGTLDKKWLMPFQKFLLGVIHN